MISRNKQLGTSKTVKRRNKHKTQ